MTTRRAIQRRRDKAVARLRWATTDTQRARIEALIASHEEAMAKHEESRPPPDGLRECTRCKARLEPTDANFPPKGDYKVKLHPECRACGRERSADGYARKVLGDVAPPTRPGAKTKKDGLDAEEQARQERAREIVLLIRRYEAVREMPGRDRDAAYNALGLRLKQHARPVSDGVREWEWDRGLGEIKHRLLHREWHSPLDPHANPRRLAKSDMKSYGDTIEFESLVDGTGAADDVRFTLRGHRRHGPGT